MKLGILATALVLGLSSVAMAAPASEPCAPAAAQQYAPQAYAPTTYAPEVRDHRIPAPQPVRAMPVTLASAAPMSRGRALIDVSSNQRFSSLSLDAKGSVFVSKVVITFANGQTQVTNLDKQITSCTSIDLNGRSHKIDKIMVYGRGGRRSSLAVTAI